MMVMIYLFKVRKHDQNNVSSLLIFINNNYHKNLSLIPYIWGKFLQNDRVENRKGIRRYYL